MRASVFLDFIDWRHRYKNRIWSKRKIKSTSLLFSAGGAYNAKRLLQKAVDHKLKVIDFLEEQQQIPGPELNKIIDICIDDYQLNDILTARKNSGSCNG